MGGYLARHLQNAIAALGTLSRQPVATALTVAVIGIALALPASLQVLVRGGDGLPRFDAQLGECTFCGDCVKACESAALDASISPPWELSARVGGGCLSARGVVCASCREACPETAIHVAPGARGPAVIDAERCTGCGACVGICPAGAIALSIEPMEMPA